MYMELKDLKKAVPNSVSMVNYTSTLKAGEPTVILRDYDEPMSPPHAEKNVKVVDTAKIIKDQETSLSYGTKPNVPGINVVNAIKAALGPGTWALHISDGSYTGYTIAELQEFIRNFDSTNLRVWVAETFDCDDFAQVLEGNVNGFFPGIAFGTIWYGDKKGTWGHAVNLFYDYVANKVYLVEPQNDVFYEFNKTLWNPWVVML